MLCFIRKARAPMERSMISMLSSGSSGLSASGTPCASASVVRPCATASAAPRPLLAAISALRLTWSNGIDPSCRCG